MSSILLISECLLLPLHHTAWGPERSLMENTDAGATHRPGALPGSFSTAGCNGPRLYTRKLRLARVTHPTSSKGSSPPRRADFNHFLMLLLQTFLTLSQIQRWFPDRPSLGIHQASGAMETVKQQNHRRGFSLWRLSSALARADPEAWRG